MRKAQKTLAGNVDTDSGESTLATAPAAGLALKEKRLTFAWLDGEAQKVFMLSIIFFHIVHFLFL